MRDDLRLVRHATVQDHSRVTAAGITTLRANTNRNRRPQPINTTDPWPTPHRTICLLSKQELAF